METKQLLNQITQQLKVVSNDSVTPAGQSEQAPASDEQLSAINQIFELFRFNYHNQFLKAFPDLDTLNIAKRLWLRLLNEYDGHVIMRAAERTVKESKWLPSVHDVVSRCDMADTYGLPSAHAAYIEACRAPSPKIEYDWTHPAVYYAGRASDWFFLSSAPESTAFPVFKRNYELLLARVQNGEDLSIDVPLAIPEKIEVALTAEENIKHIDELLDILK